MNERHTLIHVSDGCVALGTRTVKTPVAVVHGVEDLLNAAETDLRLRAGGDEDIEEQVFILRELLRESTSTRDDDLDEDPGYYVVAQAARHAA